jgi:hypothetical protein
MSPAGPPESAIRPPLSPCPSWPRPISARPWRAWRQIGGGKQFAQAQVAGAILRQQQQARRGIVAVRCVLADPDIAADDGLDAGRARGRIELDHAEQVGQVGDRQGRLAVGRRLRDRLIDARQAIGDGIFAVEPEVDEFRGLRHGGHVAAILLPQTPAESADFPCVAAVLPAPTFESVP